MVTGRFKVSEIIMGSLVKDEDLLQTLTKLCKDENILAGRIEVLGAVEQANIGFYNQKKKIYEGVKYKKNMQIVTCGGSISQEDGKPVVHLHIALSDRDGGMFGGHLKEETIIYSGEYTLSVYEAIV